VCFAFLSDLWTGDGFHAGLQRCRWLTRGWTLQELVAPQHIEFFDESWECCGSKLKHVRVLEAVTGIDADVLLNSSRLPSVSVAKRMSWASKRETTLVEDLAYSLMGLFDIHMPLIYGEGIKAFSRLQEEIARQNTDLSLFLWQASPDTKLQEFRGAFARSPSEFAKCGQMAVHHRADFTEREFTVTNKGIRIKASRARHTKAPQYFIFRTNITDSTQPPVKTTIKNPKLVYPVTMEFEGEAWFGIYLTKTARGFVRAQPEKLYVSDKEGEESVGLSGPQNETIYILKDISESESMNVRNQDIGSIGLGGYRGTSHCIIEMIQPLEAWDSSRQCILNVNTQRKAKIFEAAPWADINDMETDRNYMDAFIGLKFTSASGDHRPFRVLIACRSGTKSVVWTRSEAVQDEDFNYSNSSIYRTAYISQSYLN